MITESDYQLTPTEKQDIEELLRRLWEYLHDIIEKNGGASTDVSPELFQHFICVDRLYSWVKKGIPLEE